MASRRLTAAALLLAVVAPVVGSSACTARADGKTPVRGSADRRVVEPCPGDPTTAWLRRVIVDGPEINVVQTDGGARRGIRESEWFSDLVRGCVAAAAGDASGPDLEPFRAQLECELWLHNLAVAAVTDSGQLGRTLRRSDLLVGLLGHGRPVDLDVEVWAGHRRGHRWDGDPAFCSRVHRVVDPVL